MLQCTTAFNYHTSQAIIINICAFLSSASSLTLHTNSLSARARATNKFIDQVSLCPTNNIIQSIFCRESQVIQENQSGKKEIQEN